MYPQSKKPNELYITPLPLEKFELGGEQLCAWASDIARINDPGYFGEYGPYWLQKLFKDACDIGIAIRSERTGREVRFVWEEAKGQNPDYTGGYEAYYFSAYDKDQPIKSVVIFND